MHCTNVWAITTLGQFFANPPPKLKSVSLISCGLRALPPMAECKHLTHLGLDDNPGLIKRGKWNREEQMPPPQNLFAFLKAPPPNISKLDLDDCGIKSEWCESKCVFADCGIKSQWM